ncbi:MAG: putative sulfate exporter family transporter [Hyphomicrobiales bacterium]|nr:putative sulfate exporter family transporter [Hyphomicrobiales bacterium]
MSLPFAGSAAPLRIRPALELLPGLALCVAVAGVAFGLRRLPSLALVSPMILGVAIGVLLRNTVGLASVASAGVAFAMRRLLRLAIVLLGFQVTATRLFEVGARGFAVVALTLLATFAFTVALGRRLGVRPELAELIAAGTSICGASAVVATNAVTRAEEADVAYAVATVTLFGTLSMLLLPVLGHALALAPHAYGLWVGASVHEIAQVVAAAFQGGDAAGQYGTIAKLSRVVLLAPLVLGLGVLARRRAEEGEAALRPPFPWFVFGFLALVGLGGLVDWPRPLVAATTTLTTLLLTVALAAMGLLTDVRRIAAEGIRPLALGAAAWIFITTVAWALVETIG